MGLKPEPRYGWRSDDGLTTYSRDVEAERYRRDWPMRFWCRVLFAFQFVRHWVRAWL